MINFNTMKRLFLLFAGLFLSFNCQEDTNYVESYKGLLYATECVFEERNYQYAEIFSITTEDSIFDISYRDKAQQFKKKVDKLMRQLESHKKEILKELNMFESDELTNEVLNSSKWIPTKLKTELLDFSKYTLLSIETFNQNDSITNTIKGFLESDVINQRRYSLLDIAIVANIIRNVESFYVDYLYASLFCFQFKLRQPKVEIQNIKSKIRKGEPFTAKLFITMYDPKIKYTAILNNDGKKDTLTVKDGIAYFIDDSIKTKGKYLRNGFFEFKNECGLITTMSFKIECYVE